MIQARGQRSVDRYVGHPACVLLSWVVRARQGRGRAAPASPRAVLFIELSELGSVVLAAPAVERLRERHPDAVVHFAVLAKNACNLEAVGVVDRANVFGIRDDSLAAMAVDFARFARWCRRRGIDTAVDMEIFTRIGSLLCMLSGARTRVGFHNYRAEGQKRGEHWTHPATYNAHAHMSQNFLALVEALDCDPSELPLPKRALPRPEGPRRPPPDPEAAARVERALLPLLPGGAAPRIVVLNHDAGPLLPLRSWPEERFGELARRLLAWSPELVVVLMGLPTALEGAARIERAAASPRCVNFVGRTRDMRDVVALLRRADLLVTNDSGPAHFATLTDVKSVVLYGPETPDLYGPLGKNSAALYEGLACSPCLTAANYRDSPCTDNVCLKEIPVDEVFGVARRLLLGGKAPGEP